MMMLSVVVMVLGGRWDGKLGLDAWFDGSRWSIGSFAGQQLDSTTKEQGEMRGGALCFAGAGSCWEGSQERREAVRGGYACWCDVR